MRTSPTRQTPTRAHTASLLALSALTLALLSACGGGDNENDDRVATQSTRVTVMDGLLQNAKVCVDSNQNQVCDSTELTARTNAQGVATFVLPSGQTLGKLLAQVGTDATDADTGPVTQPYTLTAPANQVVISPLTTLVQLAMANGQTQAQAEATLRTQWGLAASVPLMGDYVGQRGQGSHTLRLSVLARAAVLHASQNASTSTSKWATASAAVASQLTALSQSSCFKASATTLGATCDAELRAAMGVGTTTPTTPVTPVTPTPVSGAVNGQALYAAHCALCHTSNPGNNASNVLGAKSAATLLSAIAKNKGGMGSLSTAIQAQQAADIATYLKAF